MLRDCFQDFSQEISRIIIEEQHLQLILHQNLARTTPEETRESMIPLTIGGRG